MTIIARFQNEHYPDGVMVEVESTFLSGPTRLAVIRALHGSPFVGGDRWPIPTDGKIIRADELHQVREISDDCECRPDRDACEYCRVMNSARWGDEIPFEYPTPRPPRRPLSVTYDPQPLEIPFYIPWLQGSGVER